MCILGFVLWLIIGRRIALPHATALMRLTREKTNRDWILMLAIGGGVRDVATPPPPAPLAHRPLAVNSANNKPTTGQQQPRRLLSPGPETPSGTPVGDKSTTMSQQQSFKPGSSPSGTGGATATEDLNLRELDEALLDQHHHQQQHGMCAMGPGRARKAGSLPPMNTTPVWVPR